MNAEQQAAVEKRLLVELSKRDDITGGSRTEQVIKEDIKKSVEAEGYLGEPWQVDYAVERLWAELQKMDRRSAKKRSARWAVVKWVVVNGLIASVPFVFIRQILIEEGLRDFCQANTTTLEGAASCSGWIIASVWAICYLAVDRIRKYRRARKR